MGQNCIRKVSYSYSLLPGNFRVLRPLQPGFFKLAEFLEKKYLPACRKDIAVTSLPNIGAQFYTACHTSNELTAEEIHKTGLEEVERIEGDMKQIVNELGLQISLKDFKKKLKTEKI
jgi:uncharacterized protein (DUF885 family)